MIRIPLSRVHQSDLIDQRILQVVKSGNFILGPECHAFEDELAAYIGVKNVVLASSWTAAVQLLHLAQRLEPGDEILVPSLTAFPSIEPMIHVGARPVFVDIDETYTMDPNDARRKISNRTVGILPVHLYGHPANLDAIESIAVEHGLWIIEDCAQSHGALWRDRRVGSIGTHAAFSFYPSKNLTVYGDGGAIGTNDDEVARRIRSLRNHGRRDKYVHERVGFNLRFNEIQAAVGREQLRVLDGLNARRRAIAELYRALLGSVPGIKLPPVDVAGRTESVYHMFVIQLSTRQMRDELAADLKNNGIETGVHYPVPNHRQPAIVELYGRGDLLPKTESAVERILSLPMFPALTDAEVREVADTIRSALEQPTAKLTAARR